MFAYLVGMRSWVRTAAGVVIALFALALAFGFPYSLLTEYGGFGSGPRDGIGGYALIAVVTGPVVALGMWLALRRGWLAVAGGLVLSVAAAVTGGLLGEAAHDRAAQARAAACSPDERSEFEALGVLPTNGEYGFGDSDGSCVALFGGRDQASLGQLREVIEGRGWQPDGAQSYAREGKRLRIETKDEGEKGLDVYLRLDP